MIRVNLLPHQLRPIKRSPLPYLASGGVAVLTVALIALMGGTALMSLMAKKSHLNGLNAELANFGDITSQYNELEATKTMLAVKIMTIDEIVKDRIIWSEQLHHLGRLAPANFWLEGVKVETKQFREQRAQFNPQTKQMEQKWITVQRPYLVVSGYVVEDMMGERDVYTLVDATVRDEPFAAMFEVESPTLSDDSFEGYAVKTFTLEYAIKRTGGTQS
jgi:hypothetical protein